MLSLKSTYKRMFTKNLSPGKFEGNHSQLLAEIVHATASDGGTSEELDFGSGDGYVDWFGLVNGKRFSFVVHETDQGFVDVAVYNTKDPIEAAQLTIAKAELDSSFTAFWPKDETENSA